MSFQNSKIKHKIPIKTATITQNPEIDSFRDELMKNPFFQNITNKKLIALQNSTTVMIETSMNERNLQKAKQYQQFSILIDKEARKRLTNPNLSPQEPVELPKNSKEYKKIAKFDEETLQKVDQINSRHSLLTENFKKLWETQIKDRYFEDSPKLTKMRKQLNDCKDQDEKEELENRISECEKAEEEMNKEHYETDYNNALEQQTMKQKKELNTYLKERKRQRNALIPLQPVRIDKSLNQAKSKYANTQLTLSPQTTLAMGVAKKRIIEPCLSKQKSTSPQPTKQKTQLNQPLAQLKEQTHNEIGCQCEDCPDSDLFDDSEEEGVTMEGDENIEFEDNESENEKDEEEEKEPIKPVDSHPSLIAMYKLDETPSLEDDIGIVAQNTVDKVVEECLNNAIIPEYYVTTAISDAIVAAFESCVVFE